MIIFESAWISIYRKVWRHHENEIAKEGTDPDDIVQLLCETVLFS